LFSFHEKLECLHLKKCSKYDNELIYELISILQYLRFQNTSTSVQKPLLHMNTKHLVQIVPRDGNPMINNDMGLRIDEIFCCMDD